MTDRRQARSRWAAAAAGLVGVALWATPLNAWLSRPFTDLQLRWLAPQTPPAGVLVVDIDDASLKALQPQFGPWPYRRDVLALLVETLREAGAQAVVVDLLLVDAKPGDEALARSLARPGAPVVLAAAGLNHASDAGWLQPGVAQAAPGDTAALPPAQRWTTIALPSPSLWPVPDQPPALGLVTTPLDADGVLRRLPLWHGAEGRRWPVLPWAVHRLLAPPGAPARPLPLDEAGALHLAWGPAQAAPPTVPLSALLLRNGDPGLSQAWRGLVAGRVVFVGSSALLGDRVLTVQGQRPGVQVLAEAYAALRDGRWLRPPSTAWNGALLALALLPWVVALRWRRPAWRATWLAALLALVALAGAAALALWWWQQPLAWAAPLAALASGLVVAGGWHLREQAAMRRRLAHDLAVSADAARAKGLFLANVSHEIRTPLNALMGVAELLAASPLTAQQRQQVQLFQEAGQTLKALINDLLDLAKVESSRLELELLPFSLHHLLRQLVDLHQPQAQRKALRLQLTLAPDVPDGVCGDRLRIERALSNLLGNALKFTQQGEVVLRVACEPGQPDGLVFEVSDTGIGIASSKLDSIFEPFSQADSSVTRRFGGTGLGLSLTRSVAELMGGRVTVASTPGVGSCFCLHLPLPQAALAPAEPPPTPLAVLPTLAPAAGTPDVAQPDQRQVLLAEDNEVNAYIFSAMLADQGLHIDIAGNGLEALAMLQSRHYDIAYLDVQMPGLDGLSVTRALREWEHAHQRTPLPVVSLTANAFPADVKASLDAGSQLHLAKPFTKADLLDSLLRLAPTASPAGARPVQAQPQVATLQPLGATAQQTASAAHARVFLQDWPQAWARAQGADDPAQCHALATDLLGVAHRLGAPDLQAAAQALLDSMAHPAAEAQQAAQARVQQTLAPVMLGLRDRLD